MTLVRDVMTADPQTAEPSANLEEVARIMRDRDTGAVPIVRDGAPVGIVTDRDIAVRAVAEGRSPSACQAEDVCTDDPVRVGPDDDARDAVARIRERKVQRVLVVEGDELRGIVSIGDLALALDGDSALADVAQADANT
ncbi:MAG: CBS domain-containing protein [Patulibacter minatonensis]